MQKRHLDEELRILTTDLLKMAALVEDAIHNSTEALKKKDKELAEVTICADKKIDELENIVEERCIDLFALFQPVAIDLRFIATAIHINAELERMADLAVNICQRAMELPEQSAVKALADISKLSDIAKTMVKKAIDAFVDRNEELAQEVILTDKEANRLRNDIIRELVYDHMAKDGSVVPRTIPLLLAARDLERICDHACAIAEDVIYMIRAKVVKHHRELL
ncbi:MAG: phosphate signaling complex protein PhoU [Candidatus Aceula meridiana]|nr:phosphate signaling complex protein PhoU [Candidatus Aceula meridiana]